MNLQEYRLEYCFYSVDVTDDMTTSHTYKIPENYKPSLGFVEVKAECKK